jgi:hypothetical protein
MTNLDQPDSEEILSAITEGISEGIRDSMPPAGGIWNAIFDALSTGTWTVLPPGSHLVLFNEEEGRSKRGVDVVALRSPSKYEDGKVEVLTCRGDRTSLSDEVQLKIGNIK